MYTISRREFLKLGSAAFATLILPKTSKSVAATLPDPINHENMYPPPTRWGRIATWQQNVRTTPQLDAKIIGRKNKDEIIPLYASMVGDAPWPTNPVWYQTQSGFIHSSYVYPSEDLTQTEIITQIPEPGFWAKVSVPIAEARWQPNAKYITRKLYYGTVYRVIGAERDTEGTWWYQLKEGYSAWGAGPYVKAASLKRILPEEMAPISPGVADKRILINRKKQTLTCFEDYLPVFSTRIATGLSDTPTPRGEFRVLYKRPARRMIGGDEEKNDRYDLPGIAFPTYFTESSIAIHGTYWHNDFGRPHSHGCVNVPNDAAQWIFRWVEPITTYETYTQKAEPKTGTRVTVI